MTHGNTRSFQPMDSERRRKLAKLPYEKKIQMAGELVKLARELKKAQSGHNPKLEARVEREDAGRFIVRADEKLTAFLELEAAI